MHSSLASTIKDHGTSAPGCAGVFERKHISYARARCDDTSESSSLGNPSRKNCSDTTYHGVILGH